MSTSGTYAGAPSVGELVLNAYSRIQVRRTALTAEHMSDARMEATLLQAQWSNRGPNLWAVDLETVNLTQANGTYPVPPETVMILDAYLTISNGSSTFDRIIIPMSRTDYASLPNKTEQAPPTSFWFDRLISPTITVWPVPDGNSTYVLNYYRYRMLQDPNLPDGTQPEIPVLWIDAFAAGLAHRLARIYNPALEQIRKADADEAWNIAAEQNTENVPIYLSPTLQGYFT